MTEPSSDLRAFQECVTDNQQQSTGAEIVAAQGAALGSMLQASEVTSCTSTTAVALTIFGGGGARITNGCEQIAAMTSAMQAAQQIFQCTFNKLMQTDSISVRTNLSVNIELAANVTVKNCSFDSNQVSGMRVAKYSEFSSDLKQALTGNLNSAMEGFLSNLQEEKNKGLFPTTDGQKAFSSFTTNLSQMIKQGSFNNTVQETMQEFENNATFTFKVGPYSTLGFDNNAAGQTCVNVNQNFVTQIVSQNIMTSALEQVFGAAASQQMKAILQNGQYKANEGITGIDFGVIGGIIVVIIVIIVLLNLKKKDEKTGKPEPSLAGPSGIILGIILLVLGIGAIIAGIVLIILKKHWAVIGITLVGGIVIGALGLVMFLRARSQQYRFKQQLELAKARSGVTTPAAPPAATTTKTAAATTT